ncbi:hypothetical protein GCM10022220_17280 [Actinocatenispora rupis]
MTLAAWAGAAMARVMPRAAARPAMGAMRRDLRIVILRVGIRSGGGWDLGSPSYQNITGGYEGSVWQQPFPITCRVRTESGGIRISG